MKMTPVRISSQVVDSEWLAFHGGELEGRRPTALCLSCRAALSEAAASSSPASSRAPRPLCFQCYRATVVRERALKAAGELDTASPGRFQFALPLERVDRSRLARLRVERTQARLSARAGIGRYADKRRQAQIAARHALERLTEGLRARNPAGPEQDRGMSEALHAAELQLPASWLPFVVSR